MPTTTCLTCWTSMRFCHLDSLPSSPLWKSTMIDLLHDQLSKSTENQKKSRKCLSMETANSKMVATMDCTIEWVQPSRGSSEQTRACSNVHVVSILNMCANWCKTYVVEIKVYYSAVSQSHTCAIIYVFLLYKHQHYYRTYLVVVHCIYAGLNIQLLLRMQKYIVYQKRRGKNVPKIVGVYVTASSSSSMHLFNDHMCTYK